MVWVPLATAHWSLANIIGATGQPAKSATKLYCNLGMQLRPLCFIRSTFCVQPSNSSLQQGNSSQLSDFRQQCDCVNHDGALWNPMAHLAHGVTFSCVAVRCGKAML